MHHQSVSTRTQQRHAHAGATKLLKWLSSTHARGTTCRWHGRSCSHGRGMPAKQAPRLSAAQMAHHRWHSTHNRATRTAPARICCCSDGRHAAAVAPRHLAARVQGLCDCLLVALPVLVLVIRHQALQHKHSISQPGTGGTGQRKGRRWGTWNAPQPLGSKTRNNDAPCSAQQPCKALLATKTHPPCACCSCSRSFAAQEETR